MFCTDCKIGMSNDVQQVFPYDKIKRIWWRCPQCNKQEVEIINYA